MDRVDEPLFTMREAAMRLSVSYSTVKRLVHSGELPAVRVGQRGVRVRESAIWEYLHPGQVHPMIARARAARELSAESRDRLTPLERARLAVRREADDDTGTDSH